MAAADRKTVAIAGGSGFIGSAIARRLAGIVGIRARLLSRNPEQARRRLQPLDADFVRAEVTDPSSLKAALADARAVVSAVQFDGYPVEDPSRGLTFERVDILVRHPLEDDQFLAVGFPDTFEESLGPASKLVQAVDITG